MKAIFTESQRQGLRESQAAGLPRAVDIMGQAKGIEFTGATISQIPNAFVVKATRPDGTQREVARFYFQDDKERAKRHAKWNATITLKALKRTLAP